MIEIERKFLVHAAKLPNLGEGVTIAQGYLMRGDDRSLRIRQFGDDYILTFKAGKGITRTEIERTLTAPEGEHLFKHVLLEPPIAKVRHTLQVGAHTWEIDVFCAENEGLIVAEIELLDESEDFERPDWLYDEVSTDPRFLNSNLAAHPVRDWFDDFQALFT
jgi:adenylate cyclase